MKKQTSYYIVIGLIVLAIFGVISSFVSNPVDFLKNVFILTIIGLGVFVLIRHFFGSNLRNREQNAFKKAARRSKKRFQQKDSSKPISRTPTSNISTFRKVKNKTKSTAQLTVIEGKKGKKKKRASL